MVETTIIQQFFFKLARYSKDIAEKIIYFLKNWSEPNINLKKTLLNRLAIIINTLEQIKIIPFTNTNYNKKIFY